MKWRRRIEVLTPLFNRGAYPSKPEIRVPSIRGMVRWWFRALGGTPDGEKELFGGMKRFGRDLKGRVCASRLVFRVSDICAEQACEPVPTLPHKEGGQASPRAAFNAGAQFTLEVFNRFGPLPQELQVKAENALNVWLLMGALGLRANRGGGSVWPADGMVPQTAQDLKAQLNKYGYQWPVMLAGEAVGTTPEELREAATDTRNGMPDVFGSARPRRASAIKFKIIRLGDGYRLLITAPNLDILEKARRALRGKRSHPETWEPI